MKKLLGLLCATMLVFSLASCQGASGGSTGSGLLQAGTPEKGEEIAIVTTSLGEIQLRFYPEEAPLAVENFKNLANSGYYDGVTFHRVIENFMIQGGDPTATGMGGASSFGADFEDEISPDLHFFKGALAMANSGPNTNGSQFFIVQNPEVNAEALNVIRDKIEETAEEPFQVAYPQGDVYNIGDIFTEAKLDYYEKTGGQIELEYIFGNMYSIFGQVFSGIEVVDAIAQVETGEADKPVEDVIIESVEITTY
ncbi:MAG: peptidylprolyl isomerase [Bacillota bacterium]